MSRYTTGEIARECSITVRTVQYYDRKGIVSPSETSEGGRRLYTDEDLQMMKTVCYLKSLGLSLKNISTLLKESNSPQVVSMLLKQQEETLKADIEENTRQLKLVRDLEKAIEKNRDFTINTMVDMTQEMEKRRRINRVYKTIIAWGVFVDITELAVIILCLKLKIWWPAVLWLAAASPVIWVLVRYYHGHVEYVCPECNEVFVPSMKNFFFAAHTPRTRKLECPACKKKSYCIEVVRDDTVNQGA